MSLVAVTSTTGPARTMSQLVERRGRSGCLQFGGVTLDEFVVALRGVAVPAAQFGGRRNLRQPLPDPRIVLAQPSGPQPVHEDAVPLPRFGLLVHPRQPHFMLGGHAVQW